MNKLLPSIYLLIGLSITYLIIIPAVFAQDTPPSSASYKVLDYGFGSGGTASSSSSLYSLFGSLGQVDQGSPSSANYFIGAGLEYEIMATQPAAPTFVNQANNYNKLHLTINRGGVNAADYQYAIRIASASGQVYYVQNDNTLGVNPTSTIWQTYSSWGESSGFDIIGLNQGATYTARVAARQGRFYTQSDWGPQASATTSSPTLSFDINIGTTDTPSSPPYTLDIGSMTPGNVATSANRAWVDVSTNATNGVLISINGTNNGLLSSSTSTTITSASNDLTAQPSGYGAQSVSVSQSSGGPMAAVSPYNGAGDNVGVLDTTKRYIFNSTQAPVTDGSVGFQLKAKPSNTTPAANDYVDTLTIIATGSF